MATRDCLVALRERWWLPLIGLLVGTVAAAGLSFLVPPRYSSSAILSFSAQSPAGDLDAAYQGEQLAAQRTAFYANLAIQPRIVDPVATRVGSSSEEISQSTGAAASPQSSLLTVSATAGTAEGARQTADALAETIAQVAGEIERPIADGGPPAVAAAIIQPGSEPTGSASMSRTTMLFLGFLIGLLAGVIAAIARRAADRSARNENELQDAAGVRVLATIGKDRRFRDRPLITDVGVPERRVEAYRKLRASLSFVDPHGDRSVIAIMSPRSGEGRSSTVANLALVLAAAGRSVLIIGADVRDRRNPPLFGAREAPGLVSALATGGVTKADIRTWIDGVDVLGPGAPTADPAAVLGSEAGRKAIASLRRDYDVVLIDTPPALSFSDAALIATSADGVLLLAGRSRSTLEEVAQTRRTIEETHTPILGAVHTRAFVGDAGRSQFPWRRGPSTTPSPPAPPTPIDTDSPLPSAGPVIDRVMISEDLPESDPTTSTGRRAYVELTASVGVARDQGLADDDHSAGPSPWPRGNGTSDAPPP